MPPSNRASSGAVFDVKPVDDTGRVDFEKVSAIDPVVNLSTYRSKKPPISDELPIQKLPVKSARRPAASIPKERPVLAPKHQLKSEFEDLLNQEVDLEVELARIGGSASAVSGAKPRYRVIQKKATVVSAAVPEPGPSQANPAFDAIIAEIQHSALSGQNVPAAQKTVIQPSANHERLPDFYTRPKPRAASAPRRRISGRRLLVVAGVLSGLAALGWYGLNLKRTVTQESSAAVDNLQSAHNDLKALNFQGAANDFARAYQNFSKAGDSLNVMGATLSDMIAELPGAGSVKSAKNLVKVGQLLSDAGSSMTQAMDAIAKTGVILNPTAGNVPIAGIVGALQQALNISKGDVTQAAALLAGVDESIIPADKKTDFDTFKSELPDFLATITQSADYAKFFGNLITVSGSKRYLILFENSSELRPTGGFPGTYAVVTFTNGKMDNLFVDDVYNLDGQLKQNIVPPLQLQAITPTWGMRDAAWFADYPTSARVVEDFYAKESGQSVDGVIVVNPQIIADMMKIVGPIDMPQYHLTLTSDNILTTIQSQVEYGPNRTQPKQVIKDFEPLLLQKIYSAKSDQWLAIFNSLVAATGDKEMLMFFNDLSLESFATDNGFGGQVKQVSGDYLMPVITNVKGSKTDAVTDTTLALATSFDGSDAVHTLTITRTHTGGQAQFGFYNKQNPAYVRVLVPDGAELISVQGNDKPNFQPLVSYGSGFTRYDQLTSFETSGHSDAASGITIYRESGKSEFGFWLITDPGRTKTVTVTYRVPKALADNTYQLYVQKQPGLAVKDFKFSLQQPDGLTAEASAPILTQSGATYDYAAPLTNDLSIKVTFK